MHGPQYELLVGVVCVVVGGVYVCVVVGGVYVCVVVGGVYVVVVLVVERGTTFGFRVSS